MRSESQAADWPREYDRSPLSNLRKVTIRHLADSQRETVAAGMQGRVNASGLMALRDRLRRDGRAASLNVLVMKILADTLVNHPNVNASIDGEDLVQYSGVNLGFALAMGQELVVPVVKGADTMSLPELGDSVAELQTRASESRLKLGDLRGATFTLSSIGMFVGDVTATAIIPTGQTGILVAGGVTEQPAVVGGQVIAAPVLPVSMTVDHRVVNGAAAGQFFSDLLKRIEACEFIETN